MPSEDIPNQIQSSDDALFFSNDAVGEQQSSLSHDIYSPDEDTTDTEDPTGPAGQTANNNKLMYRPVVRKHPRKVRGGNVQTTASGYQRTPGAPRIP